MVTRINADSEINNDQTLLPSLGWMVKMQRQYYQSSVTMRKLELWGKSQQKLEVLLEPLSESEIERKKGRKEKERKEKKEGRQAYMDTWVTCICTSLLSGLQSPVSVPNWSNQKPVDNRSLVNLFLHPPRTPPNHPPLPYLSEQSKV